MLWDCVVDGFLKFCINSVVVLFFCSKRINYQYRICTELVTHVLIGGIHYPRQTLTLLNLINIVPETKTFFTDKNGKICLLP